MRTLFPEGHDVFASGLTYMEDSRELEDQQRTLMLVGDLYGVVSGLEVTDYSIAGNPRVQVSAGLAIDAQGCRVVLGAAASVSGLTGADIGKYVVITKSNLDIYSTAHPITGAAAYTRRTDSASVSVSGSCASGLGCVALGYISNVVTGGAASVSISSNIGTYRKELRISPDRLGVGNDVAEHRLSAHADGISGGTGSLIPSIFNAPTDYITFTDMQTGNWASINGILLGTDEVNPVADVAFIGGVGGDASGSWNIYIDSTGQTGKTQAALTDGQFLLGTVTFDNTSGELTSLVDLRVFYETTQDMIRADLTEAQTNDSLTESSTLKNNLNRMRYRLNMLETTAGGAYPAIGNSNCDYNGNTDAVFTAAIGDLPASGGTLVLADGTWVFGNQVSVNKPVCFVGQGHSNIVASTPMTVFSVLSSGVVFDGIDFNVSVVSGTPFHMIDMADQTDLLVKNCSLFAEATLGSFSGELVRVAGGANVNIDSNYLYSNTATEMCVARVVQSGSNATSGLSVVNNVTEGKGNALLFRFDSGSAVQVIIDNNKGEIGSYPTGTRTWILFDSGTTVYDCLINSNSFKSYASGSSVVPGFVSMNNTGGATIVGNTAKFNAPATTFAIGILAWDESVVQGNKIQDAHFGIIGHERCAICGNGLYGITSEGINLPVDDCTVAGNIIYGTGGKGVDIVGDNNLVASNIIKGFAVGIVDGGAGNVVSGTNWNQVS